MEDYKEKHRKCLGALSPLFARNDIDRDFYYLEPYIMKNLDGHKARGIHNVTLNDLAVFGQKAVSVLSGTEQQIIVEGRGVDTFYIEEFLRAVFWEIDQGLIRRGMQPLFLWNCFHSCLRGRLASRNLVRYEKKNVSFEVSPWDTRYVSYGFKQTGLDYAGFEMERYAKDIEAEYNISIKGEIGKVSDIWTPKENIKTIDGEERKIPHNYGEVPCIYVKVPSGSMFMDRGSEEHQGESVYSGARDIFRQLCKVASILMTQTMTGADPASIYSAEGGPGAELPDGNPLAPGQTTAIGINEKWTVLLTPDMRNATRHLLAVLEERLQRATVSNIDYGNLTFPLSSVAISKLSESKDQIYLPRYEALGRYYRQLSEMIIRQYIKKDMTFELGEEAHRKSYDPKKLEGHYTINFRYFSQSREQEIANLEIGRAAYDIGMSRLTIFADINKLKDPEGEIVKRRAEDVEILSPAIRVYRGIRDLIKEEQFTEANMLKPTLRGLLTASGIPTPEERKPQRGKSLVPLMDGGGGGRRLLGGENLEPNEQLIREEEEGAQSAETNRMRRGREGSIE